MSRSRRLAVSARGYFTTEFGSVPTFVRSFAIWQQRSYREFMYRHLWLIAKSAFGNLSSSPLALHSVVRYQFRFKRKQQLSRGQDSKLKMRRLSYILQFVCSSQKNLCSPLTRYPLPFGVLLSPFNSTNITDPSSLNQLLYILSTK